MKVELGGKRLGSGNDQHVSMKNYSRSSHDLSYTWRSSMACGTLVPFMSEVALPGDTFSIDLFCDVKTLPTLGPLFGSFKVQLDVFEVPIRLFQGKLHMNMLNVGLDMSQIKLPQYETSAEYDPTNTSDNSQINASAIYSYFNVRGLGRSINNQEGTITRQFNAVPLLGYWSIYKNYYSNKQEEEGVVIHGSDVNNGFEVVTCNVVVNADTVVTTDIFQSQQTIDTDPPATGPVETTMVVTIKWNSGDTSAYGSPNWDTLEIDVNGTVFTPGELFETISGEPNVYQGIGNSWTITFSDYVGALGSTDWEAEYQLFGQIQNNDTFGIGEPQLTRFPLTNIDQMTMDILKDVENANAFVIDKDTIAPYGLGLGFNGDWSKAYKLMSQEGLGVKTYQSDLFNNWMSTEWIDGPGGINEVTAVSTAGNEFTIDALNLANKVYNMLNRIAISGGSYDDWLNATYTHERTKGTESPVYHGSLIKELAFEEVISNSDTLIEEPAGSVNAPLGTLGGRGKLTRKHKGGKIDVKIHEPGYLIGIVSITPRIDYSQGNKWDVNLKTMDDLHKPELDAIGFQALISDQLAWFDTKCNFQGDVEYNEVGKQPAWINYMTNVNQCRGAFAEKTGEENEAGQMFMTLNRRYERSQTGITDLTTYIDPSKYNQIFAYGTGVLDSQNFWVQIRNEITARRKMSAKVMPNL